MMVVGKWRACYLVVERKAWEAEAESFEGRHSVGGLASEEGWEKGEGEREMEEEEGRPSFPTRRL